jgi:tRNA(Ile)-lysidine synthetase-like protein
MKHVLAISGGVDSVVLLDKFLRKGPTLTQNVVIAHFDHGIRPDSHQDAEFVRELAKKYGLKCVVGQGNLGPNASEQLARKKRYEFLWQMADDGNIITAHHQDDLIETIVINLIRGTGWRGLAPMYSDKIERPLLNISKAEIVSYAIENNLVWVEDETNYSPKYFRNRVRDLAARMTPTQRRQLLGLYEKQKVLRTEIEDMLESSLRANAKQSGQKSQWIATSPTAPRNDILKLPENVALEVLRKITNEKLTGPQLQRLLKFLKTAKSGDVAQPGGGIQVGTYRDDITITGLNEN